MLPSLTLHLSIAVSQGITFFFSGQCLVAVTICWVLLCTKNLTQTISSPYSNPAKSGLSNSERQRHSHECHIIYNKLSPVKNRDNGNGSNHWVYMKWKPWVKHFINSSYHHTNPQDWRCYFSFITGNESEAQRGWPTCPGSCTSDIRRTQTSSELTPKPCTRLKTCLQSTYSAVGPRGLSSLRGCLAIYYPRWSECEGKRLNHPNE